MLVAHAAACPAAPQVSKYGIEPASISQFVTLQEVVMPAGGMLAVAAAGAAPPATPTPL